MDVNFFSGDNFFSGGASGLWWDVFKVILGPALGFFGAYVISMIAFRRDKKRVEVKERADRASYAELFFDRLVELGPHADSQVKNLRSTVQELEKPGDHDYSFLHVVRFNYSRVAEMDEARLYVALLLDRGFAKPEHRFAFLGLMGNVDYLAKMVTHMLEAFDRLNVEHAAHQKQYWTAMDGFKSRISSWRSEYLMRSKTPVDPLLEQVIGLYAQTFLVHEKEVNWNMSDLVEKFVHPLIECLDIHHMDPRCVELAALADSSVDALRNLEKYKEDARRTFTECAESIEQSRAAIRSAMTTLSRSARKDLAGDKTA